MLARTPDQPPQIQSYIGTESPLWSVMIPVYNCIDFLKETLESVLQQAQDMEFMQIEVVDDCSNDGNVEKLVNEIGKGRVSYFRQKENSGSLRNFETCINRSKGKYVHLLHGDDKIESGFYDEINRLFCDYPEAAAAFTNFNYINRESIKLPIENKSILDYQGIIPDFIEMIGVMQLIQPPAIVVKRKTYETLGSFFGVHYGEDWEMWARISSRFSMAYSPQYLASYRVNHGIGISHLSYRTGQNIEDIKRVIDIIQNYLPKNKRSKITKASSAYYAKYCVKVANGLLLNNKEAAFKQIKGAWSISKDFKTLYWTIRFYAMYLLRYKQIENMFSRKAKNSIH